MIEQICQAGISLLLERLTFPRRGDAASVSGEAANGCAVAPAPRVSKSACKRGGSSNAPLLRRSNNNLNQIAKHINATGRIYDEDMDEILRWQEKLWQCANEILKKLAAIA